MSRLIESIRICDGRVSNLPQHTSRMQKACREYLNMKEIWDLESLLSKQKFPATGLYKCRVLYDEKNVSVEFGAYQQRTVRSLKIVHDNSISYEYKFADRVRIDNLFAMREDCDDILIIRDGLVTDSSNANVMFQYANDWVTPESCLLKGTMRQSLLDAGEITTQKITLESLGDFRSCKLINAMILDQSQEIPIDAIFR